MMDGLRMCAKCHLNHYLRSCGAQKGWLDDPPTVIANRLNALLNSLVCLTQAACDFLWKYNVYTLLCTLGTSECVITIQTLNST